METPLDSVTEYFKHLGQITREIKREEMAVLWQRIKKGDNAAKTKMMELNLRLVVPTAKRLQRPGIELMDLVEEGNLGLLQAIERFEPSKGYRFSTYAVYWIEQYIRRYIEEQSGSIKIPSHAWGNLKRWFRAWNVLKEENGRDPSLSEMAAELDLSARQVKAIMDTLSAATGVESLTSIVGEESELTLEEVISDDGRGNPHDVFLHSENASVVQKSLMDLPERDREILTLRFGLLDNEPQTLGEVAEKMQLSRERVRQLEERALDKLRQDAYKAGILELHTTSHHTKKLHAGMMPKFKTNVLGEVIDQGPLARLMRKQIAAQQAAKKKVTPKAAAKKTAKKVVKKATKKVVKKPTKKITKKAARKTSKKVTKRK